MGNISPHSFTLGWAFHCPSKPPFSWLTWVKAQTQARAIVHMSCQSHYDFLYNINGLSLNWKALKNIFMMYHKGSQFELRKLQQINVNKFFVLLKQHIKRSYPSPNTPFWNLPTSIYVCPPFKLGGNGLVIEHWRQT